MQDYILGYGSLMSHESRLRYSDIDAEGLPVKVLGWQRGWSMCCPRDLHTCVGAMQQGGKGAEMTAVLVPVPGISQNLRTREKNYEFVQVEAAEVVAWRQDDAGHVDEVLREARVWICEVQAWGQAKPGFPIHQTYVDTCLEGCLRDFGEAFAREFIEQTSGWQGHWLNDRHQPQYPRAAQVGQDMANKIDNLLYEHGKLAHREG